MAAVASGGTWGSGLSAGGFAAVRSARDRLELSARGLGVDGVVVSALSLRARSDRCHAHAAATDHFAEAVMTGAVLPDGPLPVSA
jgi:hypothetical protein